MIGKAGSQGGKAGFNSYSVEFNSGIEVLSTNIFYVTRKINYHSNWQNFL